MHPLPHLERLEIETGILLSRYHQLRGVLGKHKGQSPVRAAVHDDASALGKDIAATVHGTGLHKIRTMMPMFAAGNGLDVEPLAGNSRGCRYADWFKSIGGSNRENGRHCRRRG